MTNNPLQFLMSPQTWQQQKPFQGFPLHPPQSQPQSSAPNPWQQWQSSNPALNNFFGVLRSQYYAPLQNFFGLLGLNRGGWNWPGGNFPNNWTSQ